MPAQHDLPHEVVVRSQSAGSRQRAMGRNSWRGWEPVVYDVRVVFAFSGRYIGTFAINDLASIRVLIHHVSQVLLLACFRFRLTFKNKPILRADEVTHGRNSVSLFFGFQINPTVQCTLGGPSASCDGCDELQAIGHFLSPWGRLDLVCGTGCCYGREFGWRGLRRWSALIHKSRMMLIRRGGL